MLFDHGLDLFPVNVIEVEIRLDDSEAAAGLTNLQVEIIIGD